MLRYLPCVSSFLLSVSALSLSLIAVAPVKAAGASVPYGLNTPEEPNISSTRWRIVVDHKRMLYFFESALTPNTFRVDLKAIDFSRESGKLRKLDLGGNHDHTYSGDATKDFVEAKPFKFLGLQE